MKKTPLDPSKEKKNCKDIQVIILLKKSGYIFI
jgi:hypothetical protein